MALPSGYGSDVPKARDVRDTKMLDPTAREDKATRSGNETGKAYSPPKKTYGKGGVK